MKVYEMEVHEMKEDSMSVGEIKRSNCVSVTAQKTKLKQLVSTLFYLLCLMLFSHNALAKLQATVNTTEIQQGYTFLLTLESDKQVDFENIDLKSLEKDFYIGAPNTLDSTSFINGKLSVSHMLRISLAARRSGKIEIPSFKIGKEQTDPIVLTVTGSDADIPKADISIEGYLNKTELYPDERATYTLKLYIGEPINNPQLFSLADENDENKDSIVVESPNQEQPQIVVRNGKKVRLDTFHYIISAKKSGTVTINGPRLQASTQRSYGGPLIPIDVRADELQLKVLDKPENYKGLWLPTPKLILTEQWEGDLSKIRVGDSLTRVISLTIRDQPSQKFPTLSFSYPDLIRMYEDKPQYKVQGDDTIMTIKQVLIARKAGEVHVPEYQFDWWNSATKSAEVARLSGKKFTILPSLDQQVVKSETPTIIDPSLSDDLSRVSHSGQNSPGLMAILGFSLAGFFFVLWGVTLFFYLNLRSSQRKEKLNEVKLSKQPSSLIAAIEQENVEMVQMLYSEWIKRHSVSESQLKSLEDAMNEMLMSQYSLTPQKWDSAPLLKLVQSVEAQQQEGKLSVLAKIEP